MITHARSPRAGMDRAIRNAQWDEVATRFAAGERLWATHWEDNLIAVGLASWSIAGAGTLARLVELHERYARIAGGARARCAFETLGAHGESLLHVLIDHGAVAADPFDNADAERVEALVHALIASGTPIDAIDRRTGHDALQRAAATPKVPGALVRALDAASCTDGAQRTPRPWQLALETGDASHAWRVHEALADSSPDVDAARAAIRSSPRAMRALTALLEDQRLTETQVRAIDGHGSERLLWALLIERPRTPDAEIATLRLVRAMAGAGAEINPTGHFRALGAACRSRWHAAIDLAIRLGADTAWGGADGPLAYEAAGMASEGAPPSPAQFKRWLDHGTDAAPHRCAGARSDTVTALLVKAKIPALLRMACTRLPITDTPDRDGHTPLAHACTAASEAHERCLCAPRGHAERRARADEHIALEMIATLMRHDADPWRYGQRAGAASAPAARACGSPRALTCLGVLERLGETAGATDARTDTAPHEPEDERASATSAFAEIPTAARVRTLVDACIERAETGTGEAPLEALGAIANASPTALAKHEIDRLSRRSPPALGTRAWHADGRWAVLGMYPHARVTQIAMTPDREHTTKTQAACETVHPCRWHPAHSAFPHGAQALEDALLARLADAPPADFETLGGATLWLASPGTDPGVLPILHRALVRHTKHERLRRAGARG